MAEREPDAGTGARRLGVMLRHSTHLLFGLLWTVALVESLRTEASRALVLPLGVLEGVLYAAGLWATRRRRPAPPSVSSSSSARPARWRRIGQAWVACLVVLWAVLCAVSVHWLWLAFPLYFLVFFLVAAPWRWIAVAAMALWSALSGWIRQDAHPVPQVVGSLIGAVVAVIGWIVLEQLRANVRHEQQLVAQVRSTQQQLLVATEQRARGQERERISRDLHDTLAQGLNSIIMLSRTGAARHPQLTEELALIETTARDNLAHARAMMRTLAGDADVPPGTSPATGADPDVASSSSTNDLTSGDESLGTAVARVVHDAQARERVIGSGLQFGFDEEGRSRPVDADLQHGLVMAVRSLVANVVQHAGAHRCQVTLTWQDDHIALDVVDDGAGFDPATASGYGLPALRARLHELDATLDVSSEPGQGCSVAITAPLTTSHPR